MELESIINDHPIAKRDKFRFLKSLHQHSDSIRGQFVSFEIQYDDSSKAYALWTEHDVIEVHTKQSLLRSVIGGEVSKYYKSVYKKIHNRM